MEFGERYTVLGNALKGGMGDVFPCQDEILSRPVAVKVIQSGVEQRRMLDEVRALLKLRSKHVVQVYDLLQLDGGAVAIVQEFLSGNDLLHEATLAADSHMLMRQLWQIAAGIRDIHAENIIHRDIKPNNMKLDGEGVIKIFDFGLARSEGGEASTMGFVGTRGFAAPELYRDVADFTTAVDVYAFGATAVFLAARGLPEELTAVPPLPPPAGFIDAIMGGLAVDVRAILAQCLSENPLERPSMEAVSHVLSRHLLLNRHQGLLVYQQAPSYLNAGNRTVVASLPDMGGIKIHYDGLDFVVQALDGDVYINNKVPFVGQVLPGSCVIALGALTMANRRRYITFDLSSPEVVL
ncbi:serine/threonine-protein kinase [Stenotrophomonas sp. CCNWLW162]|uniref:serine/threonine-protein kinase n=1 Tax=Stenotrophomonas sp. CCNWLW162 TaxID=3127480 RepID=UPI003076B9F5